MGSIKQILATSQLFERLTDEELDKIIGFCSEEVYEAGTTLFNEGEVGNRLYIVEEGRVVLEMAIRLGTGSGRQGTIAVITQSQGFGWWGGESYISTMSARCVEETKVIAIDGIGLWNLLENDHHAGYKVMKRLVSVVSSRLLDTRDMLAHILSIASHDLKSPLAAVESYHKVMLDGYAGEITEKQKTMLLRSSERITGLLNLIDNILDISRIEARELKMEEMSLLKVVESSRGVIQPLAEDKGLQLKIEVPKELPLITGAPNRLQQVFDNLLGNAVKFTPAGETVTLKVVEADDHILVEVIDTGIGILAEELPKIFTDFYRGIRVDATGAGLGLSICKKIVEAHSGKIWVGSPCSDSGVGSKFSFTLPKNLATIQSGIK
ncbi:ATP-binding protein [Chloroflexota bacterium]